MNYKNVILQDELPFDYSFDEMNTPFVPEYSKMFEHLDLSSIQRYPMGAGPNGYDTHSMIKALLFYGKSYIPVNKKNSKQYPIEIPICKQGLKMKFDSMWHEEKQDRFRVRFVCPLSKPFCEYKTSKKGCTKTFQARKPFPGEALQCSPTFKKLYPKRQAVERVNAYIQKLGWESPKCFSMNAIENIVGFALPGKSLKAFL